MKVQCGWCKKWLPDKAPLHDESVSHTICKDCQQKVYKQYGLGEVKHETT